jgi:hypothetical protein
MIVQLFPIFIGPTVGVFVHLVSGWVQCTVHRTVTGLYPFAKPQSLPAHNALTALRRARWRQPIISVFETSSVHYRISKFLIAALERAP